MCIIDMKIKYQCVTHFQFLFTKKEDFNAFKVADPSKATATMNIEISMASANVLSRRLSASSSSKEQHTKSHSLPLSSSQSTLKSFPLDNDIQYSHSSNLQLDKNLSSRFRRDSNFEIHYISTLFKIELNVEVFGMHILVETSHLQDNFIYSSHSSTISSYSEFLFRNEIEEIIRNASKVLDKKLNEISNNDSQ